MKEQFLKKGSKWFKMAAFICFGLASCSKSDDKGDQGKPSFTEKKWRIDRVQTDPPFDVDNDGHPDTDITGTYDPCELDDATVFKNDGTMVSYHGGNKCNGEEPDEEVSGTWSYDETARILTMRDEEGNPVNMDVVEVSNQQLVLSYPITASDETVYTITITFKNV